MQLGELFSLNLLWEMMAQGYVRERVHPELPLRILNYSEKTAYEGAWNEVTRKCRGLIYDLDTSEVVARPFEKFFNWGEPNAPELDLHAPAVVTDKADGSLGVIFPTPDGYEIATRGSFTSEQAIHATAVLRERYAEWEPPVGCTTLVEIVYPTNRIVVDYEGLDDLIYIASVRIADGGIEPGHWPGPRIEEMAYESLDEALAAEPRPNREGVVVYFPDLGVRVKLKQADYMALHRILTGTNARNVWEFAAVRACRNLISEPKHWGSYLGIDPARAEQLLAVGDDWLEEAGIPDEFYSWVQTIIDTAEEQAGQEILRGLKIAAEAETIADPQERYAFVQERAGTMVREVMRLASGRGTVALNELTLRVWRDACPEPTAPFARSEAVA